MLPLPNLLLWSALIQVSLAIWQADFNVAAEVESGTYLPRPSVDAWYSAPEGWEAAAPGTVLRLRQHAYNMTPIPITNADDTFQVLFRTTNSLGNATWAVTTVFLPALQCNSSDKGSCRLGVVSYQLPYDTSCIDAGPSFGLQWGEPYGEIAEMLARGWLVSVPDYEGPLGAYSANIIAGYITLDSVRAVLGAMETLGFNSTASKVALWGYSNGASATEAAAEFCGRYAPELKLSGAAVGGLSPNVTTSGPLLTGNEVSGLLVQGIIGITSQYPAQREYLISRLHPSGPYNATEFFYASYMSGWQSLLYYSYVNIFEYFIGGRDDLEVPEMQELFVREGTLGVHGTPNMPVFMYHAIDDGLTPIEDTDDLVQRFCDDGASILYHRNSWGGHNDELTNGRQRALDFLGRVLDGTTVLPFPSTGCQTVNLNFMQDSSQPIS